MKNVEIKGVIPPILTPMNADESINYTELRNQVNRMIEGGCHAYFGDYGPQAGDGTPTISRQDQMSHTASDLAALAE